MTQVREKLFYTLAIWEDTHSTVSNLLHVLWYENSTSSLVDSLVTKLGLDKKLFLYSLVCAVYEMLLFMYPKANIKDWSTNV